jgi:hypothetical protein
MIGFSSWCNRLIYMTIYRYSVAIATVAKHFLDIKGPFQYRFTSMGLVAHMGQGL